MRFEDKVVYQIYPKSFQDSIGDGWGDINVIRSRMDYLAGLGETICGSRRFSRRRSATMATMSSTTAQSTRASARWRTSRR